MVLYSILINDCKNEVGGRNVCAILQSVHKRSFTVAVFESVAVIFNIYTYILAEKAEDVADIMHQK